MAKTTFVLEAQEAKAVDAYLKVIDKQDKATASLRRMNREAGKVRGEVGQVGKTADSTAGKIASWMAGFATIGTVVAGLKAVVNEMQNASALRKEMHKAALSTEQLATKLAHLRGDVGRGGLAAVQKDISSIASAARIPLDVAATTLFYTESTFGPGKAARSAAEVISAFAAPAGLTSEEVKMLPKLMSITGADTRQKQMQLVNMIYAATKGSIAETGEYLQPFVKTATSDIARGYTIEQSLARMTSAVEMTGTADVAAEMSSRIAAITSGRNERALGFMQEEYALDQIRQRGIDPSRFYKRAGGRKRGEGGPATFDTGAAEAAMGAKFTDLTDPERLEFVRGLYHRYKEAGEMDVLKTRLDVRGYEAMLALFSPAAEKKYEQMLPAIATAKGSDAVQRMAADYLTTMGAVSQKMQTRTAMGQLRIGSEVEPEVVLGKMTEEVLGQIKSQLRGGYESTAFALTPESVEKWHVSRAIVRQNLALAYEQAGTPERRGYIEDLRARLGQTRLLGRNPQLVGEMYEATGGFGMIEEQGRLPLGMQPAYRRGMETYFGITEKTGEKLIKALDNNTTATQMNTTTTPMFPPNGGVLD